MCPLPPTPNAMLFSESFLSTSKPIFPYYRDESTIFDRGNFPVQTPDTKNFIKFKGIILPHPPLKREGSILGIGGLCKNRKIPTLPPKSPRSGVTFHFSFEFNELTLQNSPLKDNGDNYK